MKKVCLDPGHGVETPGKRSPDGTYFEHEFTLDMARRVQDILERHGVAVTMTRAGEHNVSLEERVAIANRIADLDLFVSLHSNAAGSGGEWMTARGLVAYAYGDAVSDRAAEGIMARHKEAGVTVRNGGKAANGKQLYVIRNTTAPAVLVEHLFHDNREDCALLKDDKYRQKMAEADAKGILDFLGFAWKEDEADMTEKDVQAMIDRAVAQVKAEMAPKVYRTVEDVPEWGRPTVEALEAAGKLKGTGDGEINLSHDLLRALVIMERGETQLAIENPLRE